MKFSLVASCAAASRRTLGVVRSGALRVTGPVKKALRSELYAYWRSRPVRKNVVFYESFAGNGMLCNPEAIFRALHQDAQFREFTHIWALADLSANASVIAEFAGDHTVRFVQMGSFAYLRAIATSGYLINNATFAPEFGKRSEQVYLNTWHGTPLKKMGFDIGDPATRVANVLRNFLSADFLLAPNQFTVETLFESAHRLNEIYPGKVIVEGYPRIDYQFAGAQAIAQTRRLLPGISGDHDGRKIILYAPTWKGTSFGDPQDDIGELVRRIDELEAGIDTQRYVVLLKTHQVVHRFAAGVAGLSARLVSNDIPTNAVLAATDILITDYSSIFFDFLSTGRPILFLAPDLADYTGYRGLYTEPELWPGPVVNTMEQVAQEVRALELNGREVRIAENYRLMREKVSSHDDGGATARVIDVVFRGNESGHNVIRTARSSRPRILINAGSMRANGITAALLNLLDSIEHTRFDVSVVFSYSRNPIVVGRQGQIHAAVRQFVRVGSMNGSRFDQAVRLLSWRRGDLRNHSANPRQKKLWDDEWTRCFGLAEFDFVIDFSGYGPLWATLMLHSPAASASIWLHNEMAADGARVAGDRANPLNSLDGIFSLYAEYDHLVSVSPRLSEINASSLAAFAPQNRFEAVSNTVDAAKIRALSDLDLSTTIADPQTGEQPHWASRFIGEETGAVTFVSAGHLSVEKNLSRLVRAFAAVRAIHSEARLVIIGDGPERLSLEALVSSLGIDSAVCLTGFLSNPFALMSRCDCFVLSSDHDGAPSVISEARVLGLPIVAVEFATVRDLVPPDAGIVVPATDADLAAAMVQILARRPAAPVFDPTELNHRAIAGFYAAIGASSVRVPD